MTDKVLIKDLRAQAIIGVDDEERVNRQTVLVSIEIHTDLRPAGASDKIADTIDYRAISEAILAMVEGSAFFLVERLAEEVAAICLAEPLVIRAIVTIEKPDALSYTGRVGVTVDRYRTN